MYKTEIEYTFKNAVEFALDGKNALADSLIIPAPNNSIIDHVGIIEKQLALCEREGLKIGQDAISGMSPEAIKEITGNRAALEAKEKKESQTPIEQLSELLRFGLDISICVNALGVILTSKTCPAKINGETKLQMKTFQSIPHADTKEILAEYITSFLSISLD